MKTFQDYLVESARTYDYRIKIVEAKKNYVEILENIIYIYKTKNSKTKNIITKWLNSSAEEVFTQRLLVNFNIFSAKYHYYLSYS
jgi:hypothetical protein